MVSFASKSIPRPPRVEELSLVESERAQTLKGLDYTTYDVRRGIRTHKAYEA